MTLDRRRYSEECTVLDAARARIAALFDQVEKVYVSFSGGKDSTVLTHLVMEEGIRRGRRVGILVIDLEAQYAATNDHVREMLDEYKDHSDQFWVCLPLLMRNAVTQFEPRWCCWDPDARDAWVREIPDHPAVVADPTTFPFFVPKMEFEEFVVLFGLWYADGATTGACIGIRCDESLNRYRTIAVWDKRMLHQQRWTTEIGANLWNAYPIYDWKTRDIWIYHAKTGKRHNKVYDLMHLAGLTVHQMRLCQPYGDDQRRGLWLYHLLEPQTWSRVVARVNGANSGALYIGETGNVTGYLRIARPPGHTWESFCRLLLASLPAPTRAHYEGKFAQWIKAWHGRGYAEKGIPDEAPRVLENKHWAPSWRRLCKVLLRNDWWCKGLGLTQPKSAAYERYMDMVRAKRDSKRRVA
jgi:predicted phosphoadenosine phosphosulfate sulfurtransferase